MSAQAVEEGTVLWEPTADFKNRAHITKYLKWLESANIQYSIFNLHYFSQSVAGLVITITGQAAR
jgi:hypothetical protein